jgi:hypothetical protein
MITTLWLRVSAMIEEVIPGSQPDLQSLGLEAALLINHGSPFMGDGRRPVMPNTIQEP